MKLLFLRQWFHVALVNLFGCDITYVVLGCLLTTYICTIGVTATNRNYILQSLLGTTMSVDVEVVRKFDCLLGEGPHWDSNTQSLLFVDIKKSAVNRWTPSIKQLKSTFVPGQCPSAPNKPLKHNIFCLTVSWNHKRHEWCYQVK